LYWLTRILQEANPLWRVPSYGLAISAGAITLLLIYFAGGKSRVRQFIFPIAFFLVAVPWPTPIEGIVTQSLMRLNAAIVVELLNLFGIPALAHGNIIEISTGMVGIEEACSGIRSLQATLMITLFFGEFYRLRVSRRFMLVFAGVCFAMLSNVCRTYFLVWIGARHGIPAIHNWHDAAGVSVLLVCFMGTWAVAVLLRGRGQRGEGSSQQSAVSSQWSVVSHSRLLWFVIAFVAVVEISTEVWFRMHEHRGELVQWSARWPQSNPSYQARPIAKEVKGIMLFDESAAATWVDADERGWLGFYFRWWTANNFYGRMKVAMAKGHSPEICLQAAGWTLQSELAPATAQVRPDLALPFRRYIFQQGGRTMHVFFAVVEDQANGNSPGMFRMTHLDRLRAALAGSRNFGERSVEVAVTGFSSPDEAWAAFQAQLPGWIAQEKSEITKN
jgi:exosortase